MVGHGGCQVDVVGEGMVLCGGMFGMLCYMLYYAILCYAICY